VQAARLKKETSRLEDYLEAIYHLIHEKGYASTMDLSARLGVKPPTVSAMVGRLAREGYLEHEPYRGMRLTPKGQDVAISVVKRHGIVYDFLSLLGVDKDTAYEDAEGIEHHLHPQTVRSIGVLVGYLQENPDVLKAMKGHVRSKPRQ
jgi:Mn-dependent DtxR family transcriptional regulator